MTLLFASTPGDPAEIVAQARRLADDVERMLAGAPLDDALLAGAPILDLWRPALRQVQALTGVVKGHPSVADGRQALTTEVYAIDLERGLARTWSRFYLLGRSFALDNGRLQ